MGSHMFRVLCQDYFKGNAWLHFPRAPKSQFKCCYWCEVEFQTKISACDVYTEAENWRLKKQILLWERAELIELWERLLGSKLVTEKGEGRNLLTSLKHLPDSANIMMLLLFTGYFFFKIFIYLLFYFTILYWFCHTLTWILHGCTCVPHPKPLSHLPPHPILWVIPVHQPWPPCLMHWAWTGNSFHI